MKEKRQSVLKSNERLQRRNHIYCFIALHVHTLMMIEDNYFKTANRENFSVPNIENGTVYNDKYASHLGRIII